MDFVIHVICLIALVNSAAADEFTVAPENSTLLSSEDTEVIALGSACAARVNEETSLHNLTRFVKFKSVGIANATPTFVNVVFDSVSTECAADAKFNKTQVDACPAATPEEIFMCSCRLSFSGDKHDVADISSMYIFECNKVVAKF